MTFKRSIFAVLLVCIATGLSAAPALAQSPVITNCVKNSEDALSKHFTLSQLRQALNSMPSDVQQYGDCPNVIQQAILQITSDHHQLRVGKASGGSGFPVLLAVLIAAVVFAGSTYSVIAYRKR